MTSANFLGRTLAVALAATAWGQAANAQGVGDSAGTARQQGLDEIIVTAQKREENIQSTPISITALGAESIRVQRIETIQNLTAIAPSLNVGNTSASMNNMTLFIRGIGDSEVILTTDSPVSVYVDGVVIGRQAGAAFNIVDLERIEVLRGPQGTLYGRNTIGGAVNLIARKPGSEFGLDAAVDIGNFNYRKGKLSVDTGEWGDSGLSARFTYVHSQRDGYIKSPSSATSDQRPGARRDDGLRAAVRYVSSNLTLDYAFDWADTRGYSPAFQLRFATPLVQSFLDQSPTLGGPTAQISRTRLGTINDNSGPVTDRSQGHSFVAELDLGPLTVRSLSGYRKWRQTNSFDNISGNTGLIGQLAHFSPTFTSAIVDGPGEYTLFSSSAERDQDQFSQEINILGNVGDRLNYIIGAYYFREDAKENNPQNFILVRPGTFADPDVPGPIGLPLGSILDYEHTSRSKALFAQVDYELTDNVKLTGGIRYTWDDRHMIKTSPTVQDVKASFSKFNYSASVDWQVTPDILLYARTASGYKAGGFTARSPVNTPFRPTTLTSYEIGHKGEFFDRRLRVNFDVYYSLHKDLQITQFVAGTGGAVSQIVNAGKARYWGVEAELSAVPVDGLRLGSNVGYINRKFLQYLIVDPSLPANAPPVDVKDSADFLISSPWTVSAYAEATLGTFSFGKLTARVDYDYRGKIDFFSTIYGTPNRDLVAGDARSLFNARLALGDIKLGNATAEVNLWGQNIFNKRYQVTGIDFGGLGFGGNVYAPPAFYGMGFNIKM